MINKADNINSIFFDKFLIDRVVKISENLIKNNLTITFVESCTGGLLSAIFTEISGASKLLKQSYITYSNQAKIELVGVKESTLIQFGAVSKEVAGEMAQGALKNAKSDIAVSVTGIAGPSGSTLNKPIGLVFIAIANNIEITAESLRVEKFNFSGNRSEVRKRSLESALNLIESIIAHS